MCDLCVCMAVIISAFIRMITCMICSNVTLIYIYIYICVRFLCINIFKHTKKENEQTHFNFCSVEI